MYALSLSYTMRSMKVGENDTSYSYVHSCISCLWHKAKNDHTSMKRYIDPVWIRNKQY